MNVFSGHRIDPLHIREEDIYLEDIAHALSLLCRGNGHIKVFLLCGSAFSQLRKRSAKKRI